MSEALVYVIAYILVPMIFGFILGWVLIKVMRGGR